MITVEEARKKLGKTGQKMTDEEIIKLRNWLYSLCNRIIDQVVNNK